MSRRFIDVRGQNWVPMKDAEGNSRTEPTPQDYLQGIYRGYRVESTQFGDQCVHQVIAEDFGGDTYEGDGPLVEIYGTGVLDDQLDGIPEGCPVLIHWKGKAEPKKESGRAYHNWNVKYDVNEYDKLKKEQPASTEMASQATQEEGNKQEDVAPGAEKGQEESTEEDESDDMPF